MRTLGIVPARGGSKGIPHKNLALLGGRPLLAYTADAVRGSRSLTRTVVSTDHQAIAAAAAECGLEVPLLRPAPLAADDTPMLPVVRHMLDALAASGFTPDAVVLLQPATREEFQTFAYLGLITFGIALLISLYVLYRALRSVARSIDE